jgi:hypothetical protein
VFKYLKPFKRWFQVSGVRLLVTGLWFLAAGWWLLVGGCWLVATNF